MKPSYAGFLVPLRRAEPRLEPAVRSTGSSSCAARRHASGTARTPSRGGSRRRCARRREELGLLLLAARRPPVRVALHPELREVDRPVLLDRAGLRGLVERVHQPIERADRDLVLVRRAERTACPCASRRGGRSPPCAACGSPCCACSSRRGRARGAGRRRLDEVRVADRCGLAEQHLVPVAAGDAVDGLLARDVEVAVDARRGRANPACTAGRGSRGWFGSFQIDHRSTLAPTRRATAVAQRPYCLALGRVMPSWRFLSPTPGRGR